MANRKQLDPLEVDVLVRIVEELRSELEHTVPNASWRMMADEINSALVRGAIAPETLRVLVKDRRAGASVAKILRDFAHKRRWDRRLGIREPVLAGAEPAPQVAAEAAAPQQERVVVREERYPIVALEFSVARATGLVTDAELDIARELVGQFKSAEGPSREQVRQAIAQARREVREAKKFYVDIVGNKHHTRLVWWRTKGGRDCG